ncbi:MAG TPA: peptidoglycan-associated lipoprotein Pal [Burkholderiales bacterium]|nr:peptidoglycan-associated lipoprotein Pal [Burkholderiales bacterium]
MRTTYLLAFLAGSAILLGACSTTSTDGQPAAGVEERKPGAGAETQKPRVATVDLTSKPGGSSLSALKDPNNILSKRSIYYDYDKFDVKDEYRPLIEAHAKYLRENPGAKMLIQGNTDERGGREYNVALGQRRSDGVKRMLLLLGAKEAQIESVSLGEEKPKAPGSDEAAWAQNRRSDMLYGGEF